MEFKILENFSQYKIYKNGKIYNTKTKKFIEPYFLKQSKQYTIHLQSDNQINVKKKVARLIYELFVEKINNDEQITFIDDNNKNFSLENLKKEKFHDVIKKNKNHEPLNSNKVWKSINNYENYKISDDGTIHSLLNGVLDPVLISGYKSVKLLKNGKAKRFMIHRLVYETFNNKIIDKNKVIDHIDRNKLNNNIKNLREVSKRENALNCDKKPSIQKNIIEQYDLNNNFIKEWHSKELLIENLKISKNQFRAIQNCCLGKQKTTLKFIWKYKNRHDFKNTKEFYKILVPEIKIDNYKISKNGNIINLNGKILKPSISGEYQSIKIKINKTDYKSFYIHKLVAYTFIDNPKKYNMVNHKDKNKFNNNVTNLEWVSASENSIHSHGKKVNMINKQTKEIIKTFNSISEAFKYFNKKYINSSISDVCNKKQELFEDHEWEWVK